MLSLVTDLLSPFIMINNFSKPIYAVQPWSPVLTDCEYMTAELVAGASKCTWTWELEDSRLGRSRSAGSWAAATACVWATGLGCQGGVPACALASSALPCRGNALGGDRSAMEVAPAWLAC